MRLAKRVGVVVTAAAVAFGSLGLGAGVAEAQPMPVVNQGDRVYFQNTASRGGCTVGYVDRQKSRFVVAAHCVGLPGQRVTDAHGRTIGRVATLSYQVNATAQNDYAYVSLRGAVPGRNGFSGDAIVPPNAVRPGETFCTVGASTQRHFCGKVVQVRGHKVFTEGTSGTRRGDSGGPGWIPGRGLVGVLSGSAGPYSAYSAPSYYFGPELLLPLLNDPTGPYELGNNTFLPFRSY